MSLANKPHQLFQKAKRIFSFFSPYSSRWIFLFTLSLFLSALGLATPWIMKYIIDDVILEKNYPLFQYLMAALLGITVLISVMRVYINYFYKKVELAMLYDVRNTLFSHLEQMDIKFFERHKIGDLMSRLSSDIGGVESFIVAVFNGLITNALKPVALIAISLYINWQITLITLAVVPFYALSQYHFSSRIRLLSKLEKRQSGTLLSFFEEKLNAMALIQLFSKEGYELQKEQEKSQKIMSTSLKTTLTSSISQAIVGFITFCAMLIGLWYGGSQVMAGMLTLGSLIAIYAYLGRLFAPIEALVGFYASIQGSLASVDRVFQILDLKPAVLEKPEAKEMPQITGNIEFKNVSFRFDDEPILKNIDIEIKAGETVGIVGVSGVGKTTLTSFVPRFYDPYSGEVFIDNVNLKDADIQTLRSQIGLAGQNVTLFNASIKENLTYGAPRDISMGNIIEAAKEAKIHEVINNLPHKYYARAGERGMMFSGGERQRLAIARLILKNPKIIILDEATSFMDYETELAVMENLRRIFKDRTMLVIAHRLSTLEDVSRILVLKDGSIVESGNFEELIAKQGEFYRFYNYQVGGFHRFKDKLGYEIGRAVDDKKEVALIGITIKNLPHLIHLKSEKYGLEILRNLSRAISEALLPPNFSGEDLHFRGVFYGVLPGINESQAEGIASRLVSRLMKEFADINIGIGVVTVGETPKNVDDVLKLAREKAQM